MIIYIDENLAPHLAKGLNILQTPENHYLTEKIEVKSIKEVFGQGALDEDWIPIAGKEGACVITQDLNIQHTRHQRELYQKFGLGIIFISAPKKGLRYWDAVKLLINSWEQIGKISLKTKRPFSYRLKSNGKLEDMD